MPKKSADPILPARIRTPAPPPRRAPDPNDGLFALADAMRATLITRDGVNIAEAVERIAFELMLAREHYHERMGAEKTMVPDAIESVASALRGVAESAERIADAIGDRAT